MGSDADEREDDHEDRELGLILQELRVALPGMQMLFAFLLMVPFNQRFEGVSASGRWVFLGALAATTLSCLFLITPSVYHRLHDRRCTDKARMVRVFNKLAIAGGAFLAIAIVTSIQLVTSFLFGLTVSSIVTGVTAVVCVVLWYALPLMQRRR